MKLLCSNFSDRVSVLSVYIYYSLRLDGQQ